MRPGASLQAGYFPLHPEYAKQAARQFTVDMPSMVSVLDPCVGEGHALKIILDELGVPYENVQAVELSANRGVTAKEVLPGADIISPCCFLQGCNRPYSAYTFCYVNSPYGPSVGGGDRMETQFLAKLGMMLPVGGVLCMVVPQSTLTDRGFENELGRSWRRVRVVPPTNYKWAPYNERVVCAIRHNNKPVVSSTYVVQFEDHGLTSRQSYYSPGVATNNPEPAGKPFLIAPRQTVERPLHKVALTDMEICEELLRSPIEAEICTPPPISRGRPPLALTTGHNGMLVASGQSPPVVTIRDDRGRMLEVPHLVRGVARKSKYIREENTEEIDDGVYRTKTVISEAVDLKVSVLLHTGELINLNQDQEALAIDDKGMPIAKQSVTLLPSEQGKGKGGIAC